MSRAASLAITLVELDRLEAALERADTAEGLLSADERAWTTPAPVDMRRRRRTARIALRLLLAKAGAAGARGEPLTVDRHGKPHLPNGEPAFSLAHSGGLALVVIGVKGPLGIDIEARRDHAVQLSADRQAKIIAAARALLAVPDTGDIDFPVASLGTTAFLAAWTRLEAFAKARGTGIGALLTDLGITVGGAVSKTVEDVQKSAAALSNAAGIAVARLHLPADTYGAVAAPLAQLGDAAPAWQWLTEADC